MCVCVCVCVCIYERSVASAYSFGLAINPRHPFNINPNVFRDPRARVADLVCVGLVNIYIILDLSNKVLFILKRKPILCFVLAS